MTTEVQEYNPNLQAAFDLEAKEASLNLESLMAEFLGNAEVETNASEMDEMKVRKMILAIRHLEGEIAQLKNFKKAVASEWDRRIKSKEKEVTQIKDIIKQYIEKENDGKALKLDVGTASLRNVDATFEIAKDASPLIRIFLEEIGLLDKFLKPAELDETKIKNFIAEGIKEGKIKVEAVENLGSYKPESKTLSIRMNKDK